ncbi:MAG TPA: hypothetical protein VLB44_01245 [Kofleriaceae bacterium]|nr:hypothetical protein [Kofleriaceae bacterium]
MNHRILVLLAAAGCGRIGFDASTGDGSAQTGDGMPADACAFSAWSAPVKIPALSTGAVVENGPQVSGDGLTMYLSLGLDLYVSRRATRSSAWGAPAPIAELNTSNPDYDPSMAPDELEIYFSRVTAGMQCIWTSRRATTADMWPAPTQLVSLCSGVQAGGAYLTADGRHLYYTVSTLVSSEGSLVVSTRASRADAFAPGTPVDGITQPEIGYPALSGDELTIYFEGIAGTQLDLFQASRPTPASPFGTPQAIAAFNSPNLDEDISITADGREAFFDSDRTQPGADTDVYTATRGCL